jgi:small conductance mechanosensitive channel
MTSRTALLLAALAATAFFSSPPPGFAQEAPAAAETARGLTNEDAAALDARVEAMEALQARANSLETRVAAAEGSMRRVLQKRLDLVWADLARESEDYSRAVLELAESGADPGTHEERALQMLEALPEELRAAIRRANAEMPESGDGATAVEEAARDVQAIKVDQRIHGFYEALVRNVEIAEAFGLDMAAEKERLINELEERADNLSVALELTDDDVAGAKASLALTPDDAELKARANVLGDRSTLIADQLESTLDLLEDLGINSPVYRKQIIAVTGEVNTDILNPKVALGLIGGWLAGVGDWFVENGPRLFVQLLLFVAIILAFRFLAGLGQKVVTRALDASKVQMSQLLRQMIISITRGLIMIFGVLVALSQMGISVGPLLAGLGVAGFIVGFALQDTLANFASGLMILLYRPFDVGDLVETGGVFGKVQDMSLVNTTILTVDNQTLVVPNSKIWGDVIKNVTAQNVRRVDMVFGIGYADDIPKAEGILGDIVTRHEKVLEEPAPVVKLHELGDSSVNFVVRPWVKRDDYWDVYWDITREVKMRFDAEGVSIPFPQRDVHLYTEAAVALAAPEAREALESLTEDQSASSDARTPATGLDADSPDAPEGGGSGDDGGDGDGDGGR